MMPIAADQAQIWTLSADRKMVRLTLLAHPRLE
jgi:hypothetical protein